MEYFVQLVPDRKLCSSIGRTHFELWPQDSQRAEGSWFWSTEKSALRLVPLSQNPILVDDKKVAYPSEEEVMIFDGSKVSFSFQEEVFLTLHFHLGTSRIDAAERSSRSRVPSAAAANTTTPRGGSKFALSCEELLGEVMEHWSKEERRIPLSNEGANFIGRMSHPGYFDTLQRLAPEGRPFLPFISRRHLQVTLVSQSSAEKDDGPRQQRFEVMNWSHNPIVVAGQQLHEGQKHTAQARPKKQLEDFLFGRIKPTIWRFSMV